MNERQRASADRQADALWKAAAEIAGAYWDRRDDFLDELQEAEDNALQRQRDLDQAQGSLF